MHMSSWITRPDSSAGNAAHIRLVSDRSALKLEIMNRRETQINRRGPGLKMTSCSRGSLSSELCRLFQSQCIQKNEKRKKKWVSGKPLLKYLWKTPWQLLLSLSHTHIPRFLWSVVHFLILFFIQAFHNSVEAPLRDRSQNIPRKKHSFPGRSCSSPHNERCVPWNQRPQTGWDVWSVSDGPLVSAQRLERCYFSIVD